MNHRRKMTGPQINNAKKRNHSLKNKRSKIAVLGNNDTAICQRFFDNVNIR